MKDAILAVLSLLASQDPAPLSPEEALKRLRVPEGFRVELVAAEPLVVDPVAMSFDEDGRLYVVEMRDYPTGPPTGVVKLLEDTNGDGVMDRATDFAAGLPSPSGVLPSRGGVLVVASPDLLFLKDTDGDRKADTREVVLTGFGTKQNQQHRANALQHGLDNWIYGANGGNGGDLRPGRDPAAAPVSIRGNDFRFKPDGRVEPVTGLAQFGATFDDWGRRFVCRHDLHLVHPVLPYEALKRNPHLSVPSVEDTKLSDHGHTPREGRISPADASFTTDADSSCSVTIYRASAFPPEYRGNSFVCEPVLNLVHRDVLVPRGATFAARRGSERGEFLASTDNWFRPVNLSVGWDGALYVVDFCRPVIEHPEYLPANLRDKLPLRLGDDRGRIWRVVKDGAPRAGRPRLSTASAGELVAHLESGNAWWRTTAQRLLVERQEKAAVPILRAMMRSASPLARLHALWTLHGLGEAVSALDDPDPRVRENALRISPSVQLADDPDPRVRFQAALVLGDPDALARIAVRDGGDPWTRLAVLSGVADPVAFFARLKGSAPDFIAPLAEIVKARKKPEEAAAWVRLVVSGGGDAPARWQLEALRSIGPAAREGTGRWVAWARGASADARLDVADRVAAIGFLAAVGSEGLESLLRPQEPTEVQIAAVRALPAEKLFVGWKNHTVPVRREIVRLQVARPEGAQRLLDEVEKGNVRPGDLELHVRNELARHPSAPVKERARKLLAVSTSSDREAVLKEVGAKVAALQGDAARGEKVYATNCATCHKFKGQGFKVGPDLESVAGRDRAALLADILDPSRALDPAYQMYVVKTKSGELLNGVVVAETPASLTLRRPAGEESTVLRAAIAELTASNASMMPEGVENNMSPQDFADVIELLRGGR
jgi:putative membrane-bound dehydrogenase-like protein